MPQGFPSTYGGLSQGLTSGVQSGVNIMQMVYQKAQAAQAQADKKITTSLEILKDDNIPDDVKDGFYATFKAGVEQQYPKITLPDKYTMDSKVAKQFIALGETYKDNPDLLHKARTSLLEGSSTSAKDLARFDQSMKEGKEKADTYNRGLAWGGEPGTPGVKEAFTGLRGTDPMRYAVIEQKYLSGKGLDTGDLPKDKKPTITSDELQGAMAEIGINPSEESSYTTENIGKAAKYLREQKAKASATNIILGADPNSGNIIIGSSKGPISPTTVETGPLIGKTQTPLPPDQAAKVQLIEQALSYMPSIREGIMGVDPKTPKIDRTDILNIGLRTPFTKGRELSTMILDAVEAKLRLESGAAVPDSEVKRMAKRFIPQTADNDSTIVMKIDNLEKYLKETADKVTMGRPLLDKKSTTGPKAATSGNKFDKFMK